MNSRTEGMVNRMSKLTEAVFSMQCSFIAKNSAAWAGDLLTLPEYYNKEADPRTVARFTDDMRARLDRLDEWAGRTTSPCPKVDPVAWMHTLNMEGGQSDIKVNRMPTHPFGRAGVDFDPSYTVTTIPLYAPPKPSL